MHGFSLEDSVFGAPSLEPWKFSRRANGPLPWGSLIMSQGRTFRAIMKQGNTGISSKLGADKNRLIKERIHWNHARVLLFASRK